MGLSHIYLQRLTRMRGATHATISMRASSISSVNSGAKKRLRAPPEKPRRNGISDWLARAL
jgi:hypothetical protein